MKKLLVLIFLFFNIHSVGATPPTNLQLAYNLDTRKLHIEADHPTDRPDRYFVQKVTVIKNSKEKQYFYFPRQTSVSKFIADLAYEAVPGDYLDIEVRCSQGGAAQGSIDVSGPVVIKDKK
jgi:hypothetical protein